MNSAVGAATKTKKEKRSPTCSNCRVKGHKSNKCKMPQKHKRRAGDLVNCSMEDYMLADELCVSRCKKRPKRH